MTERGVGPDAQAIRAQLFRVLRDFYETYSIQEVHREAHRALHAAIAEALTDNWDGYGARAVRPETRDNAIWFLRSLPSSVPSPDVAVDPDGEVAFEWYASPGRVFSVSVGSGDVVTFAGLKGRKRIRGTEVLVDGV